MKLSKLFSLLLLLLMGSIGASAQVLLNSEMPEGTVGMLNGREAIVVDLGGSIGKVGIATMNVGATSVDDRTGNACFGSYLNWDNAQTSVSDGWYVPSKDEFEALIKRLKSNSARKGAEIAFTDSGTSLFLPSCGYIEGDGRENINSMYSLYWTGTAKGASSAYNCHTSSFNDNHYCVSDYKTVRCVVRPFCQLPEPDRDYFSFKSVGENVTIGLQTEEFTESITLEYSADKTNWNQFVLDQNSKSIVTINNGETYYFRRVGEVADKFYPGNKPLSFTMTRGGGTVEAGGNVMSLLDPKCKSTRVGEKGLTYLFKYCDDLTTAPKLPATTLGEGCYYGMFYYCTSLRNAPELPATTLADKCYSDMFMQCSGLTTAPELPATTLANSCYSGMFYGCSSLTKAPELPALSLTESCYAGMFQNCEKLTHVLMQATDATAGFMDGMFTGSAKDAQGELTITKELDRQGYDLGLPGNWTTKVEDLTRDYLSFKAVDGNVNIGIKADSYDEPITIEYSQDKIHWSEVVINERSKSLFTISDGETFYLRRDGAAVDQFYNGKPLSFTMDGEGKIEAGGNVMSLLDPTAESLTIGEKAFVRLFMGCTKLITAPKVPATTLAQACYAMMFQGCTGLTEAPALPATTIAPDCYGSMFLGCTSLTKAPELPATTLAESCYMNMFLECTSLVEAPALPATTLARSCYSGMFQECISLKEAPALPATTLAKGCYFNMFSACISLTHCPALPAITLTPFCYSNMFCFCTSLTVAPALPATTLAEFCYGNMFQACTSLKEAPALPAETLANSCYFRMFDRCKSLTKAPELPAQKLTPECYWEMFSNCASLTSVVMKATDVSADKCMYHMVEDAANDTYGLLTITEELYNNMVKEEDYKLGLPWNWKFRLNGLVRFVNEYTGIVYDLDEETLTATIVGITFNDRGTLHIPDTITPLKDTFTVTAIADGVFMGKDEFTGVDIQAQVAELPAHMFDGCTALAQVTLPASLTTIKPYAFAGCASLVSIDIPNTVEAIGTHAFKGCTSLKKFTLPSALKDLGASVFENCGSLVHITSPLATPYSKDGWDGLGNGLPEVVFVQVPGGTYDAYAADSYWSRFGIDDPEDAQAWRVLVGTPRGASDSETYVNMVDGKTDTKWCVEKFNDGYIIIKKAGAPHYITEYSLKAGNDVARNNRNRNPRRFTLYGATDLRGEWTELHSGNGEQLSTTPFGTTTYSIGNGNTFKYFKLDVADGPVDGEIMELSEISFVTHCKHELGDEIYYDDFDHWKICKLCGERAASPHSFRNTDDPTCTICNYNNPDRENWLERDYLSFKAVGGSVNIGLEAEVYKNPIAIEFSENKTNWSKVVIDEKSKFLFTIHAGEKFYLRRNGAAVDQFYNGCGLTFTMDGEGTIEAGGNIMSLLDPKCESVTVGVSAFRRLFYNCKQLTKAPTLPATLLSPYCYNAMFGGCSSLTEAPVLPATTLPAGCYQGLFHDCYSLKVAPELPATEIDEWCYAEMFGNCASLTTAPVLPATTMKESCYAAMFAGCYKLTTAPALPATTLAKFCYGSMFAFCTSLTVAPELPATELAEGCYNDMFEACGLTKAPALPATELKRNCYANMFELCVDLTEAPELRATELAEGCYANMFLYCTSLTKAPELPATKLALHCYYSMFAQCEGLTEAPALPVQELEIGCYSGMFAGCTSLATAPVLPAESLTERCYSGMFAGCTSLATAPVLPAEILAEGCYAEMFRECTNLKEVPTLPASSLKENCYWGMFYGCTNLEGTPELPASSLKEGCYRDMFKDCSKLSSVKLGMTEFVEWAGRNRCLEDWLNNAAANGNITLTNSFYCDGMEDNTYKNALALPEGWTVSRELKANEDPDHAGVYYTTFFDRYSSYSVADGTTAYTGTVENDCLKLTATENNTIAKKEGVLLRGNTPAVLLTIVDDNVTPVEGNVLQGSNSDIIAPAYSYILSYGKNRLGFYKPKAGQMLSANKAFLYLVKPATEIKAFRMIFDDDDPDGIAEPLQAPLKGDDAIYNLQGIRQSKLQKGINIVGDKKVIIK